MSNISVRPLTEDESDLLESLFNLSISGTNQGLAKTSSTTFANTTFGGSGGGTWGSITGTLSNQTDLQTALSAKQNLATNLTSLSSLAYSSLSFVKMSAAGTFSLDTNTYLTGNQTITLSGDISGSGATSITTTLATVNPNVGTFGSATQSTQFTVNGKGLITAASNVTITPASSSLTGRNNLVGTSNQITLSASGTNALVGGNNITLSLPQDIATSSTPQFAKLGINAAASATARVTISGALRMYDVSPPNADSSTDAAYMFGATVPSGVITEAAGSVLSYAINTSQVGTRDTTQTGGIFRMDSRGGSDEFVVYGYATGSSTPRRLISCSLQNGNTALCPISGVVTTNGEIIVNVAAGNTGIDLATADAYLEARIIRNSLNASNKDMYLQYQAGSTSTLHMYSDNSETLTLYQAKVGIGTATPGSKLEVVGSFQCDSITNDTGLASANFTPSATNVTNITSSTPNNATYQRVGNIVTVFGTITVTNTLAVASEVDMSLPIASNLGVATDLNGLATMDSTASVNIYIKGDATNDRASIFFTSAGIGQTSTIYYSYQYKVI